MSVYACLFSFHDVGVATQTIIINHIGQSHDINQFSSATLSYEVTNLSVSEEELKLCLSTTVSVTGVIGYTYK